MSEPLVPEMPSVELTPMLRRAVKAVPYKNLERVPVTRFVNPLPLSVRIRIALSKFPLPFVLGFVGSILTSLETVGVVALTHGATYISAVIVGTVAGAGLAMRKFKKESDIEAKLLPVRKVLTTENDNLNMELISSVLSIVLSLTTKFGLPTRSALDTASMHLKLIGSMPKEVGEFIELLGLALSEEGELGTGLSPKEISEIVGGAKDVKEAYRNIVKAWRSKEATQ